MTDGPWRRKGTHYRRCKLSRAAVQTVPSQHSTELAMSFGGHRSRTLSRACDAADNPRTRGVFQIAGGCHSNSTELPGPASSAPKQEPNRLVRRNCRGAFAPATTATAPPAMSRPSKKRSVAVAGTCHHSYLFSVNPNRHRIVAANGDRVIGIHPQFATILFSVVASRQGAAWRDQGRGSLRAASVSLGSALCISQSASRETTVVGQLQ